MGSASSFSPSHGQFHGRPSASASASGSSSSSTSPAVGAAYPSSRHPWHFQLGIAFRARGPRLPMPQTMHSVSTCPRSFRRFTGALGLCSAFFNLGAAATASSNPLSESSMTLSLRSPRERACWCSCGMAGAFHLLRASAAAARSGTRAAGSSKVGAAAAEWSSSKLSATRLSDPVSGTVVTTPHCAATLDSSERGNLAADPSDADEDELRLRCDIKPLGLGGGAAPVAMATLDGESAGGGGCIVSWRIESGAPAGASKPSTRTSGTGALTARARGRSTPSSGACVVILGSGEMSCRATSAAVGEGAREGTHEEARDAAHEGAAEGATEGARDASREMPTRAAAASWICSATAPERSDFQLDRTDELPTLVPRPRTPQAWWLLLEFWRDGGRVDG